MPPFVPLTSLTQAVKPTLGRGSAPPDSPGGSLYCLLASAWHQSPELRVKASRTHVASCIRGLGFPTAASLLSPPGMSLEDGACRGRSREMHARPGVLAQAHPAGRHSSGSPPALRNRFAQGTRGGQGKVLPSCGHFWSYSWTTCASWHPAFIRPVGGRGRVPLSGSPGPQGWFPHATLGGRENGGKKALHLRYRESSLAPFMTAGVPVKTTARSQIPPVPTAQPHKSTRAMHAGWGRRHGHLPPRPSLGMYTGQSPSKGQAPHNPARKKGSGGKQPIETSYTWDLTCPHLGLYPEKIII